MSDKFVTIIKGEDKTFTINLVDENGKPYDLTGYTTVSACFKKADKTTLTKTTGGSGVTVLSAEAGKIQVVLSDTETATLFTENRQAMYVVVDKGTDKSIVLKGLESAISVVEKPF